ELHALQAGAGRRRGHHDPDQRDGPHTGAGRKKATLMADAAGIQAEPAADATISEMLARYWSCADIERIPADVIAISKLFVLDTLACCVVGARTEAVEAILGAIAGFGQP